MIAGSILFNFFCIHFFQILATVIMIEILRNYFFQIKDNWKLAFKNLHFDLQISLSLIVIIGIALFFPPYFDYLESRNGTILNDWLLNATPVVDVSWVVFFSVYLGIVISLITNLIHPKQLLIVLQTYALVTVLRISSLYMISLNPPVGYLEMKDPLFSILFTTHGKVCSKDLFFSGHVSTMLALYFPVKQKVVKRVILFFAVLIAVGVLVQHVLDLITQIIVLVTVAL